MSPKSTKKTKKSQKSKTSKMTSTLPLPAASSSSYDSTPSTTAASQPDDPCPLPPVNASPSNIPTLIITTPLLIPNHPHSQPSTPCTHPTPEQETLPLVASPEPASNTVGSIDGAESIPSKGCIFVGKPCSGQINAVQVVEEKWAEISLATVIEEEEWELVDGKE